MLETEVADMGQVTDMEMDEHLHKPPTTLLQGIYF